ncbi:MAG TPA: outer membrane lipoprotein carrier protein LolA [Pseudonocardiaceae bacterium]|jgi:outer membrane lipoprotein-sorting protein|nr:outer membrane lipoprotein carrier protein LolA [Pseudonocardiaceae bacterium]
MKLAMTALAMAAAGAIGLGSLTMPAGAGADPSLPPVSAEDLVASVLTAKVPALDGTVTVHNALGLPALPGVAAPLTQPVTTFRVWSDGQGHDRLELPSRNGEQVLIEDGTTLWYYDSSSRTATALENGATPARQRPPVADPAQEARELVGAVRKYSTVTVDGTGTVAGRPVYQLVLTPAPIERTLLREVRVAVDSARRVPLQLTVLANGSPNPALQIGFSDLTVGPQDPALFHFTPPAGVKVERPKNEPRAGLPPGQHDGAMIHTQGEGWDTVVLGQLPPAQPPTQQGPAHQDPLAVIQRIGRPTTGPWGHGWVIQTAVGTVLVTSDGRVAAGAVPQQVLDEALTR